MEQKKQLTKEEQLELEINFEKQSAFTQKEAILIRDSKINMQQQKMLELNIEILKLQNEKINLKVEKNKADKEKQKLENKEKLKAISQKYELEEGWGFNPDTGEIV